ncbi:MAG: 4-(cytidine 5'-diphospho)-2-C-methyl-D-erythritol kinase [Pseudomonadota bacterium]
MSPAQQPAADLVEFAPAKINLTLRVGPPRGDGYHPLDSLVVFSRDWGDAIGLSAAGSLGLELTGPGADALTGLSDNLALKAAYALRAAAGKPELGARITLEKHLPAGAGLGGGSADAAGVLRGLNRLWDCGFSLKQLAEIGSVVGSDVPACVHSAPLRMTGRGEAIQRLAAWPDLYAVLAYPGEALSTGAVFARYDEEHPRPIGEARTPAAGSVDRAIEIAVGSANDLEAPAQQLSPVVGEALTLLGAAPGARMARMSGSGSTCLAIFVDEAAAEAAAASIALARPGWRVRASLLEGVKL